MKRVRIRDFCVVTGGLRNDGSRIVASFTADLPGISLFGCLLIKRPEGIFVARPPEANSRSAAAIPIIIRDQSLYSDMSEKAFKRYERQTGTLVPHSGSRKPTGISASGL